MADTDANRHIVDSGNIASGETATWKPYLHAHIVWDWMNHDTGVTMRNTDSPLMKSNIATHSRRLAMSQRVVMIGKLRENEVESVCNGYFFFIVNSTF